MTRPPSALSQHLLTCSDLARLEIPAGRILAWLAKGWLDEVGSLPDVDMHGQPDPHGDPVFAVPSRQLRVELAAQLAAIGKDSLVLTPVRVRSVLLRAMQASRAATKEALRPTAAPGTTGTTSDDALDPVPEVLHLTAAMLANEVDALVEMTREEARLEAMETVESDPESGDPHDGDIAFLDPDDLTGVIDSWGPPEVPAPSQSDPPPEAPPPEIVDAIAPVIAMAREAPAPETPPCIDVEPEQLPPPIVEDTMQEPANEDLFTKPDLEPSVALAEPESTPDAGLVASNTAVATVPALDSAAGMPLVTQDGSLAAGVATAPQTNAELSGSEPTPRREGAESTAVQTMTRVESFLGELRHVLVELANRPQAQAVDVQPLVAAVQSGFVHSAQGASDTNSAISSLGERLGDFGKRVEVGVALAVRTALEHVTKNEGVNTRPASLVVASSDRSTIALFGIGFLLLCWTAIFWFKTGSPRLAFGTLIGANLIGCCLLAGRRRSS